ncbi:peptidase U32 family protein [Draconibacterium sp. IB214405]|uniref:peptidase U32 family protein n=1 Tax=Draconibacterium sp. IB214405 TaxID=3097352 RepID=UPI002A12D671|nr:peptidase U32 family protein [Draconibacterium sp. IB214405]MDX8340078.1 peptidase U32 family protein [Draconibacterium sp. IB214405]
MMQKPELLLPVGNPESFYAALRGGADAIYLGLKQFNARGRAKNFTNGQLITILKEAKKNNVLVYITLNTVVKNNEIPELLDYLNFLNQAGVHGIILQDWGVYFIARSFFPNLVLHASTQMGIHNSTGANYAQKKGIERVVLARELTLGELTKICKKSKVETEVFIHGALCYSFSGMCLYSSYAGGRGANRGLCTQPCRRTYTATNSKQFLFNLKDNQLIDLVSRFQKMGVSSLKVEGRMKSGEYTYRVAQAYRTALDNEVKLTEAKELLALDFGREKTAYFMGKDVKTAIAEKTVAGVYLGKVSRVKGEYLSISSHMKIEPGFRLRFHIPNTEKQETVKVREVVEENGLYKIHTAGKQVKPNSEVYLSGISDVKFPSKLDDARTHFKPMNFGHKQKILNALKTKKSSKKEEYYFRINSMEWLKKMNLNEMDGLFLAFSKITWSRFDPEVPFIQKFKDKIFIELPKFIQQDANQYYRELVSRMVKSGIRNFVISHLSQIDLIPPKCRIVTNENVYVFNDAAAKFYKNEGVSIFSYPQEIDFESLFSLSHKDGIVPMYFYPELFHSRMPIAMKEGDDELVDDMNIKLQRFRRNGITSIVPQVPVSISQSRNKLQKNGFYRYLIDFCYEPVSKHRAKTVKSRIMRSEQIQPSNTFNFNKGLK